MIYSLTALFTPSSACRVIDIPLPRQRLPSDSPPLSLRHRRQRKAMPYNKRLSSVFFRKKTNPPTAARQSPMLSPSIYYASFPSFAPVCFTMQRYIFYFVFHLLRHNSPLPRAPSVPDSAISLLAENPQAGGLKGRPRDPFQRDCRRDPPTSRSHPPPRRRQALRHAPPYFFLNTQIRFAAFLRYHKESFS